MPTDNQPYDPNQAPEPFNQDKFYQDWQSGKKPLVDAIMSNYTKPVPTLTPEQEQKAKFASGLTDTMGSLAELFAHGQGAMIRNNTGPTNQQTTNAKLQAYTDKYDNEMKQYGGIKANAELMDFNKNLEIDRMNNADKRTYYINKQAQAEKAAALKAATDKQARDEAFKQKQLDHSDKNAASSNKVQWYNAETQRINAERERVGANKKESEKHIPVYVNNKQHQFPVNLIDEVVGRAIKDGVAGEEKTPTGAFSSITSTQPISASSKLTDEQKRTIFQSVYPKYLQEGDDGNLLMRQSLTPFDKKNPNVTAQDKVAPTWKVPKVNTNTQNSTSTPKWDETNDPLHYHH